MRCLQYEKLQIVYTVFLVSEVKLKHSNKVQFIAHKALMCTVLAVGKIKILSLQMICPVITEKQDLVW